MESSGLNNLLEYYSGLRLWKEGLIYPVIPIAGYGTVRRKYDKYRTAKAHLRLRKEGLRRTQGSEKVLNYDGCPSQGQEHDTKDNGM